MLSRRSFLGFTLIGAAALFSPRKARAELPNNCPKTSDGAHVFGPWTGWQASYFPEDGKCVKMEMRARTCRKCLDTETETKESYEVGRAHV